MTIDSVVGKVERVSDSGNLLGNLKLIDIKTWQTSQEVYKDWQNGDSSIVIADVNTANMGIYRLVNREPVFYLLGREGNPFVDEKFRKDAYRGIVHNYFFFPSGAMKEHILAAIHTGQSATVHYSGLRVKSQNCGPHHFYVEVDGKNTGEEEKLFVAVYGIKNPGNGKSVCVHLLSGDDVRAQLKGKKEDDVIVRACYFNGSKYFDADGRHFVCYYGVVRGVRKRRRQPK